MGRGQANLLALLGWADGPGWGHTCPSSVFLGEVAQRDLPSEEKMAA